MFCFNLLTIDILNNKHTYNQKGIFDVEPFTLFLLIN